MWYDKAHKKFGDINYKINKAYCDKHGYDIIRDSSRRMPNRKAHFERIALIKEHLPQYEYAIWIDADAYFHIDSPPIHLAINDYAEFDFILSNDVDRCAEEICKGLGREKINSGFFIAKSTDYSMEILDLWGFDNDLYERGYRQLEDQGVLRKLYEYNVSEFQKHSVLLPYGFLQLFGAKQDPLDHQLPFTNEHGELIFVRSLPDKLLSKYNMKKPYIKHMAGTEEDERINTSTDYYNHHISKK